MSSCPSTGSKGTWTGPCSAGRWWAGSRTASRAGRSPWRAGSTGSPATRMATTCTAAPRASTRSCGRPEPSAERARRCSIRLHQPGRRGGLPGHAQGRGRVLADRGRRALARVPGRHGQAHARQPDQPRLLEPGRRGPRRRPRARVAQPVLPARGRGAHPHGRGGGREGHADRLHHAEGDRP